MIILTFITFLYPALGLLIVPYIIFVFRKNTYSEEMKWFAVIFAIIIGGIGYNIGRLNGLAIGDMNRYYVDILMMSHYDLSTAIEMDGEGLFVRAALLWFVSRTENNYLLNYIIGFTDYFIVFYTLFDYIKRTNKSFTLGKVAKFFVLIIGVIPFFSVIGNVRAVTSFIFISFATYRDLIQNKRNIITYLLYILPIFLHVVAVAILILRLLQFATKRLGRAVVFLALFLPMFIGIANDYVNVIGIDMLTNLISKAYLYLNWTEGGFADEIQTDTMNIIIRAYGTCYIGAFILLSIVAKKKSIYLKEKDIFDLPMVSYVYTLGVCALGCLYITTGAFWRFFAIFGLYSFIVIVPLMELENKFINITLNAIFLSSFFMLIISLAYLPGGRIPLLEGFITTTGIEIIYYLFYGIINVFI